MQRRRQPEPPAPEAAAPAAEPPPRRARAEPPAPSRLPPSRLPPRRPRPGTAGATAAPAAIMPVEGARPIKVGDVLNHIFEVKRFLARGGMGEVFEGCNVNTDERVAIKVMLPAMAADEKVVAMFRKEARTLTKLQHEALVSYRVLAQEPQLGALYIVTEFIEGVELADMLGKVERTPEELAGLLRRLASGLSAAHRLGAVHRDMSPDNVLLPGGDVHQAKIIDFGIAKDLDASSATIVGDGFAGKLNYVAPEQLGDYGREVGPWTDVYSLALVILAVAQGKNVNMSGSLVDAIDKRRKGPDMSAVPASLRPLLEDDAAARSQGADALDGRGAGARSAAAPCPRRRLRRPRRRRPRRAWRSRSARRAARTRRCCSAASSPPRSPPRRAPGTCSAIWSDRAAAVAAATRSSSNDVVPAGDPVATARNAINSVLPSTPCTWLDIAGVEGGSDGVNIALRGVAGDAAAAQQELNQALTRAGLDNARLDFGDVAPITPAGCAALDTYRQVRASSDYHLSVARPRFEMMMQPPGTPYAGEEASNAVINFNFANAEGDFAILGIEPSGTITNILPDRASFEQALHGAGQPDRRRGQRPLPAQHRPRPSGLVGHHPGQRPRTVRPRPGRPADRRPRPLLAERVPLRRRRRPVARRDGLVRIGQPRIRRRRPAARAADRPAAARRRSGWRRQADGIGSRPII